MEKLTPLQLLGKRAQELDDAQRAYESAYEHAIKSGISKNSIGTTLGCSGTAVTKYARRHGWLK